MNKLLVYRTAPQFRNWQVCLVGSDIVLCCNAVSISVLEEISKFSAVQVEGVANVRVDGRLKIVAVYILAGQNHLGGRDEVRILVNDMANSQELVYAGHGKSSFLSLPGHRKSSFLSLRPYFTARPLADV